MYKQDVSLITTIYNEGDNILQFLKSYQQQSAYATEFIILDGGSSDNTVDLVNAFVRDNPALKIRLIVDPTCSKSHTRGPIAKGRNRAISEAKYPIIAATDAGCVLDPHWLEEITKPFADPGVDVVAGFFTITRKNEFQKKYADIFVPHEENYLPSARSVAFKKESWAKAGGFPESSFTAEDTLFALNLLKAGCRYAWNKKALVSWDFARDEGELKKKLFQYGYGEGYQWIFVYKYAYRMLSLVCPIFMIPKLVLHGKKKRLDLTTLYFFYFNQCRGFISGALDRIQKR